MPPVSAGSAEPPPEEGRAPPTATRGEEHGGRQGRGDVLGALAIIAVTAGVALGPRLVARLEAHPSAAECEALIERYAELKERSVTEKVDPKRREAALEDARRAAGPSFSACRTLVTREELDCARGAHHVDEIERCLR